MAHTKSLDLDQDVIGRHNSDLNKNASRIVQGGSWKRQNTIVLLPSDKMVPLKCAMSWWNLIFPPNNGVYKIGIVGEEVGIAYSNAIQSIIDNPVLSKFQYILTIEHDNAPPPDGVLKLIGHMDRHPEFSVISGLYWTKGEGGAPQIWGDINDPILNYRPQPPRTDGGLVECYGTGMGFAIWRLDMFKDKQLRRPWFQTQAGLSGVGTQDLYFSNDYRKYGYRCAVACDVLVGHYDAQNDIMW